LHTLLDIM